MPPFPFKSKAELEVHTSETCLPGASLPVEIVVCLQEELKPRQVRLELVGQETYYEHQTYPGTKGRPETRTVRKVNTFASIPHVALEQPSLVPGVEASREVSIQIPFDAPPSCRGEVVDVRWILKATLDVPGRLDQVREVPLQVMRTAPINGRPDGAGKSLPAQKSFDDCTLELEVPGLLSAKETVRGRLLVKALRAFQVRGIRVEVVRLEDAGAQNAENVTARQDLSGSLSLNPMESPSFAFSMPLPETVAPTMASPHSSLRWQVRAVLDRRLRTDFNVQQDVFIYNATEQSR